MNLVIVFCLCSGPWLGTYSKKYTKYTDPKLLVHYWDHFYLVKQSFYCSLEITRHSYSISFCFSLKAAGQRWSYSVLPLFFFCSTVTEWSRLNCLPDTFHRKFLDKSEERSWINITSVCFRTNQLFKTNYQHMFLSNFFLYFPSLGCHFMNSLAISNVGCK